MKKNGKLTNCESCGKLIAISAENCPSCGAKNSWIHPKIKYFLNIKDKISEDKFNYTHTTNTLRCYRTKENIKYQFKFMYFGLAVTLIALPIFYIDMELAGMALCLGVGISVFGQIIGGVNIEYNNYITFTFEGDSIIYESNDHTKWETLIADLS